MEDVCRHLSDPAAYEEDIDDLREQVQLIGPGAGTVLCTWPPTAGGPGFSAFATYVRVAHVRSGRDREALVVAFRGTKGKAEWARFPVGVIRRPSEMEGVRVFPPWKQALE